MQYQGPMQSHSGGVGARTGEDIAIVGMACIFPGAPDIKSYWRNILCKVDAVSDPPPDWGTDPFYDPDSTDNDRVYCRRGGYLHDLASFDPLEYGVMPTSIDGGEPDHFLALRVAHEALADAGYRRDGKNSVRGDRVEVILGRGAYINRGFTNLVQHGLIVDQTLRLLSQLHPEHTEAELSQLRRDLKASLPPFNPEMAPGLVPNILSGRIANRLDLMGPNFTIDAACASSLIAVERAMQDLAAGRCDMALTGGIHCTSPPPIFMVFCQLNALSRRGKIQPFSEEADGTLLGEGLGMIVLKRSADALRDGNRIYATIRAIGTASDGRALGLLAPRVEGEELAMRRAYQASGVSPSSIGLLEAHGTGTAVGDQTEAEALARVFGSRNGHPPSCALGSVKSMISHLIPAAGIAGIIKVALALHHKILPPTLHCERPNPKLGLDRTPLFINTEARPWIHGLATPRRAGVNAFGFGGINAHAILEESTADQPVAAGDWGPPWDSEVVTLRAMSRAELVALCKSLEASVPSTRPTGPTLCDLAYSVNCQHDNFTQGGACLAIVASSLEDLGRKLSHSATRLADPACTSIRDASGIYFFERQLALEGKVAFLFPGEGSQYLNMFADLCMRLPTVRERFDLIDRAFSGHTRGCLPSQVIFPPPLPNDAATREQQERRLEAMDFAAEAVFAASQGMLALLEELQILPDMVAGHSGGEVCALLAAGVIRVTSDAEFIRHITDINQLYLRLAADGLVPGGCALAVSGADRDAVIRAIRECDSQFQIGMDNCPHQVVLCGSGPAPERLTAKLRDAGALCTLLPFQRPYHTPSFESYCAEVRPFFDRLQIGRARVRAYCGATARPFPEDAEEIRALAARQMALPVRFRETLEAMHDDGARVFVEVGPKGILSSFVADTLRARRHLAIAADLPHASGVFQLNQMLAQLAAHGVRMRLHPLYERRGAKRIALDAGPDSREAAKPGMRLATCLAQLRLEPSALQAARHAVAARRPAGIDVPLRAAFATSHELSEIGIGSVDVAGGPVQGNSRASMHAYLTTMDRFLQVQQEVMQAYLGRKQSSPAVAETVSLTAARAPAHVNGSGNGNGCHNGHGNGAASIETALPAKTIPADRAKRNGHVDLVATLQDVISERTGYPVDMLVPTLNLEADLGVDSIKRIEILGTLHRRTGVVGPERMERVSSLRTIREIVDYLDGDTTGTLRAVHSELPLSGKIEAFEAGAKVVSVREFDAAHDLFLDDHALGGRISTQDARLVGLPLIPLTMTMEMMAEVAAHLVPDKTLIEMRNVRGLQWLALDQGKLRLRTTAVRQRDESAVNIHVEVRLDVSDTPVAEAVANFADRYPDPPSAPPSDLGATRASQWTPDRLYRDHMFHGPAFRGIESIDQWGERGLSAILRPLPTSGLFQGVAAAPFLTDPVLVDAAGQMVGYWAAEHLPSGFNVFPYRIEALHLYGPALSEERRAACRAHVRTVSDSQIHADIDVVDDTGRLLRAIRGWEDLRVDMPSAFYRMCISPRGVYLSSARSVSSQTILCSLDMNELPSLTAQGGIWLRALAHILLSARERQSWWALGTPERRRVEWLMGRCCAKDAVRRLTREKGEPELLPADVEIVAGTNHIPLVASGSIRPAISISHADGVAIAAATMAPGVSIGVDVQRLDPSRDGFEDVAFSEQERAMLPASDVERRRDMALRFWCAKEAAAKALGQGMLGGPGSVIVRSFDIGSGAIGVEAAGALADPLGHNRLLAVDTARYEDLIVATCLKSEQIHELSQP
jgi:acyl transferase domain-containing protein/acyl carrier protein